MMLYNKGDTINLTHGGIALVLDSGTKGTEFCRAHNKKRIKLLGSISKTFVSIIIDEFYAFSAVIDPGKEHVFHSILIGDKKGWVSELSLRYQENKNQ